MLQSSYVIIVMHYSDAYIHVKGTKQIILVKKYYLKILLQLPIA